VQREGENLFVPQTTSIKVVHGVSYANEMFKEFGSHALVNRILYIYIYPMRKASVERSKKKRIELTEAASSIAMLSIMSE